MVRGYRYGGLGRDPHWITTKYPATAEDGTRHPAGTRAFYYPGTKRMFFGEAAEQASRDFDAARQDEEFMRGQ